mmetsp:Transcript_46092/g.121795  ORF Transcript_46092/g.121795 Transcript_46092/m.121795 type:complete len:193 (-) Transcript_46092:57-635(-)
MDTADSELEAARRTIDGAPQDPALAGGKRTLRQEIQYLQMKFQKVEKATKATILETKRDEQAWEKFSFETEHLAMKIAQLEAKVRQREQQLAKETAEFEASEPVLPDENEQVAKAVGEVDARADLAQQGFDQAKRRLDKVCWELDCLRNLKLQCQIEKREEMDLQAKREQLIKLQEPKMEQPDFFLSDTVGE